MPKRRKTMPVGRLLRLWCEFREAKRTEIAPTTYGREYGDILKRIDKIPREVRTAKQYRAYLLETYSVETAKRTYNYFNACCKWAVREGHIVTNPFELDQIRTPKQPDQTPEAFSQAEMLAILQAFSDDRPYYLPWVQAMFWLAARPEELRALKWEHLSSDGKQLWIKQAWPIDATVPQDTKNRKTTRFPLNSRLQTLFQQLKPFRCDSNDWIFKGRKGTSFNYSNFHRRHWVPTLKRLVKQGTVSYYGPQTHARHTGITMMVKSGMSLEDISYLTRTSREIILKHYLAKAREISVPEY